MREGDWAGRLPQSGWASERRLHVHAPLQHSVHALAMDRLPRSIAPMVSPVNCSAEHCRAWVLHCGYRPVTQEETTSRGRGTKQVKQQQSLALTHNKRLLAAAISQGGQVASTRRRQGRNSHITHARRTKMRR